MIDLSRRRMGTSRIRLGILISLVPIVVIVGGCASATGAKGDCELAFDRLEAIDVVEGMYNLVSVGLAQTLNSCDTMAEWSAELRIRPEKVGSEEILDDELIEYLVASCDILPNDGVGNAVCDQAHGEGLFQPSGTQ